jgi:hypothetical protein
MRLFFLIPLATGLLSSYVSLNNEEDITYIFGVIAAGSLILSLILAPWELQLLILLLVIVNLRQFWLKGISKSKSKDNLNDSEVNNNVNSFSETSPNDKALIPLSPQRFTLQKISAFLEKKSISVNTSVKPNTNETKKLETETKVKYRGVEVTPEEKISSLEAIENNEILGKYRGQPVKSHSFSPDLKLKKKSEIKYRGVSIDSEE